VKPRTQHDTAYPPTFTLKANGVPVDITGATVIMLMLNGATLKTPALTVVSALGGQVRPTFAAGDVDTPGLWSVKFQVIFADTTQATFPNGQAELLPIEADLNSV
jgi:hypothetical protein